MLPEYFKEKMKGLLSPEEYREFIDSLENGKVFHALRINTLKCSGGDEETGRILAKIYADSVNTDKCRNTDDSIDSVVKSIDECNTFKKVPWEENGYYYSDNLAPGKHPYHEAGLYYIQEPSAMAPVHFLAPKEGDRVLDLCAAPGGKSTQILNAIGETGLLVSNEINRERARILSLNIERYGVLNAMVLNETPERLADIFEGYFDKILVDAPCSGEGMFRKNEPAAAEWSQENVLMCAKRQEEILENAARMLAPGGRLAYSTCTFSPEENEQNIYRFLKLHPDFHSVKSVRLWPHKLEGEGHFLCVMERDGKLSDRGGYVPNGRIIPASKNELKPYEDFMTETLTDSAAQKLKRGTPFIFGEQLYLAPEGMPSTRGLKVLRPGLHLGTVKKDRFEPAHALALFLDKEDAQRSVDYDSDSDEIRAYLNGQTIRTSAELSKGWVLITTGGYSIGWAKYSSGMLKNHYPKGLRINYEKAINLS